MRAAAAVSVQVVVSAAVNEASALLYLENDPAVHQDVAVPINLYGLGMVNVATNASSSAWCFAPAGCTDAAGLNFTITVANSSAHIVLPAANIHAGSAVYRLSNGTTADTVSSNPNDFIEVYASTTQQQSVDILITASYTNLSTLYLAYWDAIAFDNSGSITFTVSFTPALPVYCFSPSAPFVSSSSSSASVSPPPPPPAPTGPAPACR